VSHLLYSTRLWWDGRRGLAMLHGRQVPLSEPPPAFAGAHYVDYAPEVRCAQWRPYAQAMRDMEPAEVAAADAFLRDCCASPAPAAEPEPEPVRAPPQAQGAEAAP
jgi:hypothetical protein